MIIGQPKPAEQSVIDFDTVWMNRGHLKNKFEENKEGIRRLLDIDFTGEPVREKIAETIHHTVRRAVDFRGIARKMLLVDELPKDAEAKYDVIGHFGKAAVHSCCGGDPVIVDLPTDILTVPTFEIGMAPGLCLSQLDKSKKFRALDRLITQAIDGFANCEMDHLIKCMEAAHMTQENQAMMFLPEPKPSFTSLECLFRMIETHDMQVKSLVMHPGIYSKLREQKNSDWEESGTREILCNNVFAELWGANIYVSSRVPESKLFAVASPDEFGVMPIRKDIHVKPRPVKNGKMIWDIKEEIGIGIYNSAALGVLEWMEIPNSHIAA